MEENGKIKELNNFKLYDAFGNRIYTTHDIADDYNVEDLNKMISKNKKHNKILSYNTVKSLARRFKLGFKKQGVLYFNAEDVEFMKTKSHNAGRPEINAP